MSGAFNKLEVAFRPRSTGQRNVHVNLVGAYLRHPGGTARSRRSDLRANPPSTPFPPLSLQNRSDLDTRELVSSWLLVTSTAAPVVTKTYDMQLAVGTESHKKIAYANQWDSARVFQLHSSDENKMRVRYARMEVAAHATGFIKLWFAAASQSGAEELFVFVNDADDQIEECLLLRAQYV